MATYAQIQDWVRRRYEVTVKSFWIAHVKELKDLPVRVAPNRRSPNMRAPRAGRAAAPWLRRRCKSRVVWVSSKPV